MTHKENRHASTPRSRADRESMLSLRLLRPLVFRTAQCGQLGAACRQFHSAVVTGLGCVSCGVRAGTGCVSCGVRDRHPSSLTHFPPELRFEGPLPEQAPFGVQAVALSSAPVSTAFCGNALVCTTVHHSVTLHHRPTNMVSSIVDIRRPDPCPSFTGRTPRVHSFGRLGHQDEAATIHVSPQGHVALTCEGVVLLLYCVGDSLFQKWQLRVWRWAMTYRWELAYYVLCAQPLAFLPFCLYRDGIRWAKWVCVCVWAPACDWGVLREGGQRLRTNSPLRFAEGQPLSTALGPGVRGPTVVMCPTAGGIPPNARWRTADGHGSAPQPPFSDTNVARRRGGRLRLG